MQENSQDREIMMQELAQLIYANLKIEFSKDYVSGNLLKTIIIKYDGDKIIVRIPAPRYNMKKYLRTGIMQYYPNAGSYASEVDIRGGTRYIDGHRVRTGEHKDYVNRAIDRALQTWCRKYNLYFKDK